MDNFIEIKCLKNKYNLNLTKLKEYFPSSYLERYAEELSYNRIYDVKEEKIGEIIDNSDGWGYLPFLYATVGSFCWCFSEGK